jgi:Holliday junction resolvase
MAATPEAKVKAKIKAWLKEQGIWFFMPVSNGMGAMGVPDLICCAGGRFVAIEVKAKGKRGNTTVLQDKQIMGIHQAGGVAVVVDDVSALEGIFKCA